MHDHTRFPDETYAREEKSNYQPSLLSKVLLDALIRNIPSFGYHLVLGQRYEPSHRTLARMTIFLVAFVLLAVGAYFCITRFLWDTIPISSLGNIFVLSPLVHIAKVNDTASLFRQNPLVKAPILMMQVSRSEPSKVFLDAPQPSEPTSSDDNDSLKQHLHVSNTFHTIVQFHVSGNKTERCSLAVKLPSYNATLQHEYKVKDVRGTVRLNICELNVPGPLNSLNLTWKNRPKCAKHPNMIDARVGEEVQGEPFTCQPGSFKTYEISCAEDMPSCMIDIWSVRNYLWGLHMLQHQAA